MRFACATHSLGGYVSQKTFDIDRIVNNNPIEDQKITGDSPRNAHQLHWSAWAISSGEASNNSSMGIVRNERYIEYADEHTIEHSIHDKS